MFAKIQVPANLTCHLLGIEEDSILAFDICAQLNMKDYPKGYKVLGYYEPEHQLQNVLISIKSGRVYKGDTEC